MAIPRRPAAHANDPNREALLRRGAAELMRLNPHIGAPPPAFTDEECTELLHDDEELAALWASPEGQRAQQLGYSAADAVEEDRGE